MSTKQRFESILISIKNHKPLSALNSVKPYNRLGRCLAALIAIAFCNPASADNPYLVAKGLVTTHSCAHGESVDEVLDRKVRPSRRDLGWRVFEADDGYIVERAFMVSKSMEIRYRWHVSSQGEVYAENSRTENLCS